MPEKILIVEDDSKNMKLLLMTLGPHDYVLLEATDGEEALGIATRDKPDLIIMDIQLPKMSGLDVTRKLRQIPAFNHVPIIAITAYAMKGDKEKFIESGCDAYLSKPIDTRELPDMVAKSLRGRKRDDT